MPEVLKDVTINLFADDTLLYISGKNIEEITNKMNGELKCIVDWLNSNKLKLNVKKTKCMLINNKSGFNDVDVLIDGEKIEKVNNFKYLGIMIDRKLTLNENVNFVCKKLAKKIGFFGRIAKNLTFVARVNVYKSIIAPHFDFCSSLLLQTSQHCLNKLQRLQNRAIRVILRCSRYSNTEMMYEALHLMNVRQRLVFNTLKLVFKIKNGMVPEYVSERVTANMAIHNFNLRDNSDFRLPLYKKTCTQRMLLYDGLKRFNGLPKQLKSEVNENRFINELKNYCRMFVT